MALTKAQQAAAAKKAKAAAAKSAAPANTEATNDGGATEINLQHLTHIVTQTQSAAGFCYSPAEVNAPLLAAGLVAVREDVTDESGHIATKATEAGIAYVASRGSPFGAAASTTAASGNGGGDASTTGNANQPTGDANVVAPASRVKAVAPEGGFKLVSGVPMPEVTRKFGAKPAIYPFADMEVGQSFFVAATEARPNPAKQMASTVNSATQRFTVEDGTHVVDGQTVAKWKKTRTFSLRNIDDGAPYGFPGVKGAAVFRTA